MSIFTVPVVVPIYWIALPIILFMIVFAFFAYTMWDDRKFCPEKWVIKTARKNSLPILKIHMHNGYFKRVLGEKDKSGSIIWKFDKKSKEGLKIDPRIQGGSVPKGFTDGGLVEYDYSTSSPFTMDSKSAVARENILKYVREKYPLLSVLDGQTVLEYIGRDRNYLFHDCKNLAEFTDFDILPPEEDLTKLRTDIENQIKEKLAAEGHADYDDDELDDIVEPEYNMAAKKYLVDYRANMLTKTFMRIQDDVATLPLPPGKFFSFAEAFLNLGSALTSFDLQTVMQLLEQIARAEADASLKWVLTYAMALAFIIVAGAVAYMFVNATGR